MTPSKTKKANRVCIDCGKDISDLHHNAKRCIKCSKLRKKSQDSIRHKKKRKNLVKWQFFIEDPDTRQITHRNAKGTKLRYWVDKMCKFLTIEDLNFLLNIWDYRSKDPELSITKRREYRTCAGMVRDWRDYYSINQVIDNFSFDSETGIVFHSDGSYLTVDFDEENESYIVRNSEGTVICQY